MQFEDYLKQCNENIEEYNPLISFVDYPVFLYDTLEQYCCWTSGFIQYTDYDHATQQFITHIYAYKKPKGKRTQIQEVARRFEHFPTIVRQCRYTTYGSGRGFYGIFGKVNPYRYYYSELVCGDKWVEIGDWYDERIKHHGAEINEPENIIAADLSLQYFAYQKDKYVNLLDYIKCYRKYPIAEVAIRLELYRLATNEKALKIMAENKHFRKFLYKHQEECKGMAFQTIYNSFKKNADGNVNDYYNSLMYRINCGKEVASSNKELYHKVLKYTTQERLKDYFEENNISKHLYFDYIAACDWLKLNLEDTKILYPRNFMEIHDAYTEQFHREKSKAERDGSITDPVSKGMFKTFSKYYFFETKGEKYSIIIAKCKYDLIEESSVLKHCVGRMDYDHRQAREKSMICFVRKNEELDKPLVTVELDLTSFKILQCYGINNSMPESDVKNFVNAWQSSLKETFREHICMH